LGIKASNQESASFVLKGHLNTGPDEIGVSMKKFHQENPEGMNVKVGISMRCHVLTTGESDKQPIRPCLWHSNIRCANFFPPINWRAKFIRPFRTLNFSCRLSTPDESGGYFQSSLRDFYGGSAVFIPRPCRGLYSVVHSGRNLKSGICVGIGIYFLRFVWSASWWMVLVIWNLNLKSLFQHDVPPNNFTYKI